MIWLHHCTITLHHGLRKPAHRVLQTQGKRRVEVLARLAWRPLGHHRRRYFHGHAGGAQSRRRREADSRVLGVGTCTSAAATAPAARGIERAEIDAADQADAGADFIRAAARDPE